MGRSDNWRINKSSMMAIEGAQILRALEKVAGAVGLSSDFKVRFTTKGNLIGINFTDKIVSIGGGRIFDEAPLSSDKFDILVGLVLHKVMHQLIDTDQVELSVTSYVSGATGHLNGGSAKEALLLHKFLNIGEDICVEARTPDNLSDYKIAKNNWAIGEVREARLNNLLEIWIEYAVLNNPHSLLNLPAELVEPMNELVNLTKNLRYNSSSLSGGSCHNRADQYILCWNKIKDVIMNPPEPPEESAPQLKSDAELGKSTTKPPIAQSDKDTKDEDEGEDKEDEPKADESDNNGQEGTGQQERPAEDTDGLDNPLNPNPEDTIDEDLAKEIEDAIKSESEDITDEILEALGVDLSKQMDANRPIIRSRESKTPTVKPDAELSKRLGRILTIRKRLQLRVMRGEQYGKIDKGHLHRIATDQKIFNLKYKFPDGFPNTKVLLDLSGSMTGKQCTEVLEAASALQTVIGAEVWSYRDTNNGIQVVRLDDGKLVHSSVSGGGTPSGTALMAVSLGMKRGGLIIHLTDGAHNTGISPFNVQWKLKERGINAVHLIWQDPRQYNYDGISWRKLNGLEEFPEALYQILVEQSKLNLNGRR